MEQANEKKRMEDQIKTPSNLLKEDDEEIPGVASCGSWEVNNGYLPRSISKKDSSPEDPPPEDNNS